jgi:hypothetical protein
MGLSELRQPTTLLEALIMSYFRPDQMHMNLLVFLSRPGGGFMTDPFYLARGSRRRRAVHRGVIRLSRRQHGTDGKSRVLVARRD